MTVSIVPTLCSWVRSFCLMPFSEAEAAVSCLLTGLDSSFVVRRLENFFLFQTHLGKLIQTVSAHEDCWDIPFLGLLGYSLAGIAREMVVIAITLVPCFAVTVLVAVGRAR